MHQCACHTFLYKIHIIIRSESHIFLSFRDFICNSFCIIYREIEKVTMNSNMAKLALVVSLFLENRKYLKRVNFIEHIQGTKHIEYLSAYWWKLLIGLCQLSSSNFHLVAELKFCMLCWIYTNLSIICRAGKEFGLWMVIT